MAQFALGRIQSRRCPREAGRGSSFRFQVLADDGDPQILHSVRGRRRHAAVGARHHRRPQERRGNVDQGLRRRTSDRLHLSNTSSRRAFRRQVHDAALEWSL